MRHRLRSASLAVAAALSVVATASNATTGSHSAPPCAARDTAVVRWVDAAPAHERTALDRRCAEVGPPARASAATGTTVLGSRFAIVSWNTHIGAGDVDALVADLR